MKTSIVDILVFKTPFEDTNSITHKFNLVKSMWEDYIQNTWLEIQKENLENEMYNVFIYKNDDFWLEIKLRIKKNDTDYFPFIIINYFLNEYKFEKENIESFLQDNIKFIYNVFSLDFFIDYNEKFTINDINKWKKIEYKNLKKFDLENKNSQENKQILDSLMYIYFNLIKNIFEINSNTDNINKLKTWKDYIELTSNLENFSIRQDKVKNDLIMMSDNIKKQIDLFVWLIK